MNAFWLTLLLLLMAASGLFLFAGLRRQGAACVDRDALNQTFYHQRLAELEQDEAQGAVAERQEMVLELQRTLLADVPVRPVRCVRRTSAWVLAPGVMILLLVTIGFYLKTGNLLQLMAWKQLQNDLPLLRAQLMDARAQPLTMAQLAQLRSGIRTSLQQHPENADDWMLLGRISMVLNDARTARQAFQRALQLQPDNQALQLDYADVLTRSSDVGDNREASALLQELLQHGQNLRLLELVAINAWGQRQYERAIAAWQAMLLLLPAGDQRADMIRGSIAQAKMRTGQQNSKLAVTVSLSSGAKKMLPPGGVLYISVTDGTSPVPVAMKKLPASHFPLSLTLETVMP